MDPQAKPQLPIINFTKDNLCPGSSCWLLTSNEVRHALEEYGCFVAVFDKINMQMNKDVFRASRELFDLPLETKIKNVSDNIYYGYLKLPMIPLYESLGINNATTSHGILSFSNIMFPSGNDHFCKTMHLHANRLSELEQMVARMVFESYGVEKHYESYLKSMTYLLRMMRYRLPGKDESNVGAHEHTDKSFITILHEDQVGGIEIKTKANEWIPIRIPAYCYLVMAGDALLAWSNDKIHSAFHQVIIRGEKERYSMGLFSFVNGIIQAPEELVDDEHPRQYKPFHHYDLLDFYAKDDDHKTECTMNAYRL
ncbi:putative 2-oxoglutarate-dependent dioxygenase AOP1 [Apium graveolens]|uniref:putative 2-oxoglutarate-dependent dioxygenase AOP1 n=1 Tax=Apium graveolens TaxID=4045 RepID=UPI003D7B83AA